ncbi:hypothetical protein [uncultured Bacteroides sp.]|nr:hypothetical protein [uncultured Bacteroides sp.]
MGTKVSLHETKIVSWVVKRAVKQAVKELPFTRSSLIHQGYERKVKVTRK